MTWLLLLLHIALTGAIGLRILMRSDLNPDARMGWFITIILLPYLSCILYFLFGEVALRRLGRAQHLNVQEFIQQSEHTHSFINITQQPIGADSLQTIATPWKLAFSYAASINGFIPLGGHSAQLMEDGTHARQQMLQDMDNAQHEIHVLYYIWLDDHTGNEVGHALIRAAERGVTCRAIVDGLGSRAFLHSAIWKKMQAAGVQVAVALPIQRIFHALLTSRLDLRNHRKITVIDGSIAYCGSQNCADEAFSPKAQYGPWVDIMLRMQGPVVDQLQCVFASDWNQTDAQPFTPRYQSIYNSPSQDGFPAVVIAEGPTERARSTPQLLSALLACATQEIVISTPYFVPDRSVLDALCAAAWRGVVVKLIFPQRNDSAFVGGASRSYYATLLHAGVQIYEFTPSLLHSKTLCIDWQLSLIGSTNLDLRSFDLNFENNVLLQDSTITRAIRARQETYLAQSQMVSLEQVKTWPWKKRIWNNVLAMLSPVL